jgi:hypothetical protein
MLTVNKPLTKPLGKPLGKPLAIWVAILLTHLRTGLVRWALLLSLCTHPVQADFNAGYAAYRAGDYHSVDGAPLYQCVSP